MKILYQGFKNEMYTLFYTVHSSLWNSSHKLNVVKRVNIAQKGLQKFLKTGSFESLDTIVQMQHEGQEGGSMSRG